MLRRVFHPDWLAAIASFAMMLTIQVVHAPILHVHTTDGGAVSHCHTSCGHRHSHHENESPENSQSPEDAEDCHICQFLAQGVQPVTVMTEPVGLKQVVPAVPLQDISSPVPILRSCHARGPPAC